MISMFKHAAFAVCCAASVGAIPLAHADGFGIQVSTGPGYYNGYSNNGYSNNGYSNYNGYSDNGYSNSGYYSRPANYGQRCVRDYYGEVVCRRAYQSNYYEGAAYSAPAYYSGGGYYSGSNEGSGIAVNYSNGWNHRHRHDHRRDDNRRDRDDGNRWER